MGLSGIRALSNQSSTPASGPGSGDVVGPASATDNAVAVFNGTTGKIIKNSLAIVSTAGMVSAPGFVTPPVTLTDAATVATDASLSNYFRVTLGGNRTLGNPTNPTNGQKVVWEIIQDGTGTRTLAYDTQFTFGTDITGAVLTTTLNKRDFLGAIYNSTTTKWYVVAFVKGY